MDDIETKDAPSWCLGPFEKLDRASASGQILKTSRRAARVLLARLEIDPLDEPRVDPLSDQTVALTWDGSHHTVTAKPFLMDETRHLGRRVGAWLWAREIGKALWIDGKFADAHYELRRALAKVYPTVDARRKSPGINPAEDAFVRSFVEQLRHVARVQVCDGTEYRVFKDNVYRIIADDCVADFGHRSLWKGPNPG